MRVNVTYSMEIDEVKELVQELLLKAENNLQELQELFPKVQDSVGKNQEKEAASYIQECSEHISSFDHALFDCRNILNGFRQASLQAEQHKKQVPQNFAASLSQIEDMINEGG